ncbi:MAG: NADH-quinone oxidoreductase subunit I [Actinomycetota bacterium]
MANVVDETPPIRDDYQLAQVEGDYFKDKLRPKQFLHIDQSECILCEGCVDICPWKCIFYLSLDAISEAVNVDHPGEDPQNYGFFVVDENECTRCALCIDRCPTNVISLGKFEGSLADQADQLGLTEVVDSLNRRPWDVDTGQRDFKNGYAYGMRW